MGEMVRCAGEVHYFRYYKRLGQIAKLATSYSFVRFDRSLTFGYLLLQVQGDDISDSLFLTLIITHDEL